MTEMLQLASLIVNLMLFFLCDVNDATLKVTSLHYQQKEVQSERDVGAMAPKLYTKCMLNSAAHEISYAHKYENINILSYFQAMISIKCYFSCMPTIVSL